MLALFQRESRDARCFPPTSNINNIKPPPSPDKLSKRNPSCTGVVRISFLCLVEACSLTLDMKELLGLEKKKSTACLIRFSAPKVGSDMQRRSRPDKSNRLIGVSTQGLFWFFFCSHVVSQRRIGTFFQCFGSLQIFGCLVWKRQLVS